MLAILSNERWKLHLCDHWDIFVWRFGSIRMKAYEMIEQQSSLVYALSPEIRNIELFLNDEFKYLLFICVGVSFKV